MFTRTVQIVELSSSHYRNNNFKAVLDAGCHVGDLITSEVITALGFMDRVQPCDEVLGICLNGSLLKSNGTITLRWQGVGFYKIFETCFHIVEGDFLAWQIILGAETCATHSLLTVGAFGGSKHQVFQRKGKSKSKLRIFFITPSVTNAYQKITMEMRRGWMSIRKKSLPMQKRSKEIRLIRGPPKISSSATTGKDLQGTDISLAK